MKTLFLILSCLLQTYLVFSQTFIKNYASEVRGNVVKVVKLKNGGSLTVYNEQKFLGIVSSNIEYSSIISYSDSNRLVVWEKQIINTIIDNCIEDYDGNLLITGIETRATTLPSFGNDVVYQSYQFISKVDNICSNFLWKKGLTITVKSAFVSRDIFTNRIFTKTSKSFIYQLLVPYRSNSKTHEFIQLQKNGNINWQRQIEIQNTNGIFDLETRNNDLYIATTNNFFGAPLNQIIHIDSSGVLKNVVELNTNPVCNINNIFFEGNRLLVLGNFVSNFNNKSNSCFVLKIPFDSLTTKQHIGFRFTKKEEGCNYYSTKWQYDTLYKTIFLSNNFIQPQYWFNTRIVKKPIEYLTITLASMGLDLDLKKTSKVLVPVAKDKFFTYSNFNFNITSFELSGKYLHYFIATDSFVAHQKNKNYPLYFNVQSTDTSLSNSGCASVNNYFVRDTFMAKFLPITNASFRIKTPDNFPNYNTTSINNFTTSNVEVCFPLTKPVADFQLFQRNSSFPLKDVVCNATDIEFRDVTYGLTESIQWIFPKEANLQNVDSTCYPSLSGVQFSNVGIFPVSIVAFNGKVYDTLTRNITVINFIPQPNLGNDTTFCNGDSVLLIYKNPPNSLHYFIAPGVFTANDTLVVNKSGQYIIAAYTACGFLYDTINVTTATKPTAKFGYSATCNQQLVTFTDSSLLNFNPSISYK